MGDLSGDLGTLRLWRENNERKSREIVDIWIRSVGKMWINWEKKYISFWNKRLYKEFPDSLRVKKLEAMCYEANENYEGALKILNDIITVDSTNSSARKRKVAVLKAQNRIPDTIKELVDYLKIYMADSEAWQELSELYISENDFNKACFCIEELILHNPHNHLLHQRLADVRYTQGGFENMELARAYYCQALKLNSKNLRALYGLYLVASSLAVSSRSNPQKKKENNQLAQWSMGEINKIYSDAKLNQLEERLAAIQL
ncbi:hypothetical protein WA026_003743 [Henosepilachna vigintioctopunctata]|uniref:ER membrane protein complex subunit 2 n=1 Tax=Henosepilachna vigintioctopunctata TaxID=420089 RepID=A0AAW1UE50_9CUCU